MTRKDELTSPWWVAFENHLRSQVLSGSSDFKGASPFSAYVHVPFCDVRCGYCDFNTYVADFGEGANRDSYHRSVVEEIEFSSQFFDRVGLAKAPLQSLFFGGGTPSLVSPESLASIVSKLAESFGFTDSVEVTLEANPDTLDESRVREFRDAGINRVSIGMQSAVPHVLSTLDRTHRQGAVEKATQAVKSAGLPVSVDLIYGTPGESLSDWQKSLEAALALKPDHLSAYSLIIEEGTKMGADLRRGRIAPPDPDSEAEKYVLANQILEDAGMHWYEISNFASSAQTRSVHNQAYWFDSSWWGYGAGSHSHLGDARWWNVRHPTAYAHRTKAGVPAAYGGELLGRDERALESIMLAVRTVQGVTQQQVAASISAEKSVSEVGDESPGEEKSAEEHMAEAGRRLDRLTDEGLLEVRERAWVLTLRGRLLADLVTRRLLGWD